MNSNLLRFKNVRTNRKRLFLQFGNMGCLCNYWFRGWYCNYWNRFAEDRRKSYEDGTAFQSSLPWVVYLDDESRIGRLRRTMKIMAKCFLSLNNFLGNHWGWTYFFSYNIRPWNNSLILRTTNYNITHFLMFTFIALFYEAVGLL